MAAEVAEAGRRGVSMRSECAICPGLELRGKRRAVQVSCHEVGFKFCENPGETKYVQRINRRILMRFICASQRYRDNWIFGATKSPDDADLTAHKQMK